MLGTETTHPGRVPGSRSDLAAGRSCVPTGCTKVFSVLSMRTGPRGPGHLLLPRSWTHCGHAAQAEDSALFLALWRPVLLAQMSTAKTSSKNLINGIEFASLGQWMPGAHTFRHMDRRPGPGLGRCETAGEKSGGAFSGNLGLEPIPQVPMPKASSQLFLAESPSPGSDQVRQDRFRGLLPQAWLSFFPFLVIPPCDSRGLVRFVVESPPRRRPKFRAHEGEE